RTGVDRMGCALRRVRECLVTASCRAIEHFPRPLRSSVLAALVLISGAANWDGQPAFAQAGPCGSNPVVCENQHTGNPSSEWDVTGAGDPSIQGFATDISVNKGDAVHFKVTTTAANFSVDIYRLGYSAANGARKVATIAVVAGQNQPACLSESATGLVDCGNWTESTAWNVPATAVSGIYIARLARSDNQGASHIPFI